MSIRSNVFVGIKPDDARAGTDLGSGLEKYDYALLPLTNTRYRDTMKARFESFRDNKHDWDGDLELDPPQLQELGMLPSNNGALSYIGLVSSFLELESDDPDVRALSLQVLRHELQYAIFIGIKQVILAPPKRLHTLHYYAQSLSTVFDVFKESCPTISISLPLFEDSDPLSTWELWNTIRKSCSYETRLTVSLALPRQKTPGFVLNRWLSEPVTCLLLSASIFAMNQYNYPVLNKFNQHLITEFQRVNGNACSYGELAIVLHGMDKYTAKLQVDSSRYLEYINYLLKRGDKLILMESSDSPEKSDPMIMPPLLPHEGNLTNSVYQAFEQDLVKYDLYEKAITEAVSDVVAQNSFRWKAASDIIILIAGAGRGPLVDRTFKVMACLGVTKFRVIAIEKNPQALLYLQKRNHDHWGSKVEIIRNDIRGWSDKIIVDICITELLGSFGCNELSPECIAPIEALHSKPNTIFIPQSYSSYAAPVSSPIIYQSLSRKGPEFLEKPSVIHNIPYCRASSRVNELWKFSHMHSTRHQFNKSSVSHFRVKHKSEIHGIAGYFTAHLYGDISLSILPNATTIKTLQDQENSNNDTSRDQHELVQTKMNHTENMRSWSPIFFPLKEPLYLNDDTELEFFISRNHIKGKVWYEWSVSSYVYLILNNGPQKQNGERVPSTGSKDVSDIDTHKLSDKLAELNAHGDILDNKNRHFEDSVNAVDFTAGRANAWDSVKDLHELQNRYNATADDTMKEKRKVSYTEEYHVRVRTSVSNLHNCNGHFYSIVL